MDDTRRDPLPIELKLGYRFRDGQLLETALTHRSHSHECGAGLLRSYERLEFLGDALLGFVVAERLYEADLQASEGLLSRRRQLVVRSSTLAEAAARIGLADDILLGRGEERTGGRSRSALLADTFEAVLGAVYLDGGIRAARAFVRRHLKDSLTSAGGGLSASDDFKTRLQERVQARLQVTPHYRIVSTSGPAHAMTFEAEVLVREQVLGRGQGTNRKRAEQEAARLALAELDLGGD